MKFLRDLTTPRKTRGTAASLYSSIYPEDVRYALSYKQAKMGIPEISALISRFTYEALYLVIKATDDIEQKRHQLEELTALFAQPDYQVDDLKAWLHRWLKALPADTQVNGTKLAQVSRYGSETMQGAFRSLAERCYQEDSSALICLIAHTALLGYRHFVQFYKDIPNAHITILVPDWMMDPANTQMGYCVTLNPEVRVTLQEKKQCLVGTWTCQGTNCPLNQAYCGNAFFVDDTIHTGQTAGKMQSFWDSEYGLHVPNEKIRVLTDLRD